MQKKRRHGTKSQGTTLAYVRWFDSAIYKGEAFQADDLAATPSENESAGVLVREDAETVAIALDRCLDTKDIRLVLCIPKVNIRTLRKITVR